MGDDVGYGDVSCNGATAITTPHIDALAEQGLRFTSGYCSASTCTPTRYSFLTGSYAFRKKGTGIAAPTAPAIIQPGTATIASLLRDAGYNTAVVGKWHLGLGGPDGPDWNGELNPGPLEIGFDTCFLLPTTNDRVPQVFVEDHHVKNLDPDDPLWVGKKNPSVDQPTGVSARDTLKMDWSHGHNQTIHNGISRIGFYTGGHAARFRDEDLADTWVKQSKKFIKAIDLMTSPSSCFLQHTNAMFRESCTNDFRACHNLGPRGDAILELDWCVGELTQTLADEGLTNDTLIVFCSDNGPVLDDGYKDQAIEKNGSHHAAGPYSGGKYSVYEGGTRTPFITCWPGTISPGVSDEMVCTIDLATSLNHLVDHHIHDNDCLDSLDVSDALLGKKGAKDETTSSNKIMEITGTMDCGLATGNCYDTNVVKHAMSSLNRNLQTRRSRNTNFLISMLIQQKRTISTKQKQSRLRLLRNNCRTQSITGEHDQLVISNGPIL